jgi:TnpA family transposase
LENTPELDKWTLTASERDFIASKNASNRLDAALLLKAFQNEGRFPASVSTFDVTIIEYLAGHLNVATASVGSVRGRTLERIRSEIRTFCGFREASVDDAAWLAERLCEQNIPQTRNPERLVAAIVTACRERRIEPPADERIERIARHALRTYEERFYARTLERIAPASRAALDALLRAPDGDDASDRAVLNMLRNDAGRIGINSIKGELAKLEIIRKLELPADLFAHAQTHELELYRKRVAVETPYELRRHPEETKLTWLAAFAHLRGRAITDTLTELLVDTVHRIGSKADRRVSEAFLDDLKRVTGKTNLLFQLADATLTKPDGIVRDVVFPVVGEATLRDLVKEWKATGPTFKNTLRGKIRDSYRSHYRQMLPALQALEFRSNNETHQPVIRALEIIKRYADSRARYFPTEENVPLDFVPPLWRDDVVEDDANGNQRVNRITYEITVLDALRDQVRCKEVWIVGADRYRNPDDDVPADFDARREEYYAALKLPLDPDVFISALRDELHAALQMFNDGMPTNDAVKITNKAGGWIGLSPLEPQPLPPNITALKAEIGRDWPMTSLLDILKETDLRLNFTDAFRSVTSHENLERETLRPRILLCIHGIGTNTGLQRMHGIKSGTTHNELIYTRRRFFTIDGLRNAIGIVTNGTLHARNPEIWGNGTNACSSDSKHFGAWDQNLTTQWHMRYGGPGIMIYWHVERKSLCIHSQLKSPSSSEVASMIEGVLHHVTEMSIERQYVDSHGQSEVAFAFCRLLGFELLPRLKAIHKQKLSRPEAGKNDAYSNLEHILAARSIDWEMIRQQYDQMIKYVTALRIGTAQTESILRRFTKNNGQHPTYKAFSQLGKAIKTIFLCHYLHSESLRREIHEGLNVGEQWNGANDFVFFAKRGELASNRSEDHEISMLCLHLIQNSMVYINTLMMQQVLDRPHWANRLTKLDFRAITPLIWEHINPYGRYELDMNSRLALN